MQTFLFLGSIMFVLSMPTCDDVKNAYRSTHCCDSGMSQAMSICPKECTNTPQSARHVTYVSINAGPYNDPDNCIGFRMFWNYVNDGITGMSLFNSSVEVAVRGAGEGLSCPTHDPNDPWAFWANAGFGGGDTLSPGQLQMEQALLEIANGTYHTDGVVLVLENRLLIPAAQKVTNAGIPLVLINKDKEKMSEIGAIAYVGSDDKEQGKLAARKCMQQNRNAIAFVTGDHLDRASIDREAGVRMSLPDMTVVHDFYKIGNETKTDVVPKVENFDCFIFSSSIHMPFYEALLETKPNDEDITIVGFDGDTFKTVHENSTLDSRWDFVVDQQPSLQADFGVKMVDWNLIFSDLSYKPSKTLSTVYDTSAAISRT